MRKKSRPLIILMFLLAGACTSVPTTAVATPTLRANPVLTVYNTATFTPSPSGPPPTHTPLPTLTPTPVQYVVQKEDDMMGISLRYGISLAALKTANPTVDPHFLSVGMTLIIPVTITPTQAPSTLPGKSTATPTPLPVNVEIDQPVCYLVTQTGLTCMALAHNQGDSDLENVSVEFQLAGGSDPGIIQRADTPLDLLIHGAALPVSVTFPSITQASSNITARLSGALPHASADTRYVPATLAEKTIDLYGNYASISGSVHLAGAAQEVWALAAAYNLDGVLVGVRKWESSGPVNGQDVPFSMTVYSLGADIAKVDVFTEAHARANP